jgi:hypothetical protein
MEESASSEGVFKEGLSNEGSSSGVDQASKSGRGDGPLTGDDLATELIPGNSAADGTGGSGCSEKVW